MHPEKLWINIITFAFAKSIRVHVEWLLLLLDNSVRGFRHYDRFHHFKALHQSSSHIHQSAEQIWRRHAKWQTNTCTTLLDTWAQLYTHTQSHTQSHHSVHDRDNTPLFYQFIPIIPCSVSLASSVGFMYHLSSMLTGLPHVRCDGRGFGEQLDPQADTFVRWFVQQAQDCGPVKTSSRNMVSIDKHARRGGATGPQ